MKIMTKTSSASLKAKFKYCYKIKRSNNYQAVFKNKGKQIYVGTFDSVLKAAIAADYKRVELGFDRNKLNFPEKYEKVAKLNYKRRGETQYLWKYIPDLK